MRIHDNDGLSARDHSARPQELLVLARILCDTRVGHRTNLPTQNLRLSPSRPHTTVKKGSPTLPRRPLLARRELVTAPSSAQNSRNQQRGYARCTYASSVHLQGVVSRNSDWVTIIRERTAGKFINRSRSVLGSVLGAGHGSRRSRLGAQVEIIFTV